MAVDCPETDEICVILPTGEKKFVSGLCPETCCSDVVSALLDVVPIPGTQSFYLWECWRSSCRLVQAEENVRQLINQWGEFVGDVRFELRPLSSDEQRTARWARREERLKRRLAIGCKHRKRSLQEVQPYASRGVWRYVQRKRVAPLRAAVRAFAEQNNVRTRGEIEELRRRCAESAMVLESLLVERDVLQSDLEAAIAEADRVENGEDSCNDCVEDKTVTKQSECDEGDELRKEIASLELQIEAERESNESVQRQLADTCRSVRETDKELLGLRKALQTLTEQLCIQTTEMLGAVSMDRETCAVAPVSARSAASESVFAPATPTSTVSSSAEQRGEVSQGPGRFTNGRPPPPKRSTSHEKFRELQEIHRRSRTPSQSSASPSPRTSSSSLRDAVEQSTQMRHSPAPTRHSPAPTRHSPAPVRHSPALVRHSPAEKRHSPTPPSLPDAKSSQTGNVTSHQNASSLVGHAYKATLAQKRQTLQEANGPRPMNGSIPQSNPMARPSLYNSDDISALSDPSRPAHGNKQPKTMPRDRMESADTSEYRVDRFETSMDEYYNDDEVDNIDDDDDGMKGSLV